jgi:cobalamin biosynthesis protein CobT
VVTEVFRVDPQSAAGQGVVAGYVEMGAQNIMLAQLSSEVKAVELENPLVLEEKFRVYVSRPAGDSNADTDTDNEEDAVVVQFKGFVVSLPSYSDTESDEESEEGEEGGEEAASSEDDEDRTDEENGEGEVDGDAASASSNAKDIDRLQLEQS